MSLGQQAMEKQTKSIILNLYERLDLEMDDKFLRSLNHQIYPKISELYKEHVEDISLSGFPDNAAFLETMSGVISDRARNADMFKQIGKYWKSYRTNYDLQELTWQNSMGLLLGDDDLEELNSKNIPYLKHIFESAGQSVDPHTITNGYILHPSMHKALDNDMLLKAYRDSYYESPINVAMRDQIAHKFRDHRSFFSTDMKTTIDPSPHPYEGIARRRMMEFGFFVMLTIAHRYMEIIPHNTLGRYPKKIGGRVTTDIYKSQLNHVLFSLLVEIPYHIGQLRINSRRIDTLWEMGCQRGYW